MERGGVWRERCRKLYDLLLHVQRIMAYMGKRRSACCRQLSSRVGAFQRKAWLGTVLIDPAEEKKGHARVIIEQISKLLGAKHKAMFAAVPIDRSEWILFLSQCGFEQLKTEKDEKGKSFMIM